MKNNELAQWISTFYHKNDDDSVLWFVLVEVVGGPRAGRQFLFSADTLNLASGLAYNVFMVTIPEDKQ